MCINQVHFNDIERADVDHVVRNLELDGLLGDYTLKRGRSSTVSLSTACSHAGDFNQTDGE